uniref:Uncharacterized protein n=1 Tax=Nelumbo nucifera TaxID=4432 RepID=A0A822YZR0_NELNU|nr:TPA_asm: hypothetical protein HUJ06_005328 [Nelumbo nucifera]
MDADGQEIIFSLDKWKGKKHRRRWRNHKR